MSRKKKFSTMFGLIVIISMVGCSESAKEAPATDFKYTLNEAGTGVILLNYRGGDRNIIIPAKIEGYPVVALAEECFKWSCVIPDTVTFVGQYCFAESSLKTITLSKNIKYLSDFMFYRSDLESIDIPEGVEVIEYCTFYQCVNLKKVKIPNSITRIGNLAFSICRSLTEVELPNKKINHEFKGKPNMDTFSDCKLNITSQKK